MDKTYPPVLNKPNFVRRFMAHEFGNKGPNWDNLEEYLAADYKGLVHIRARDAWRDSWYDVPAADVEQQWCDRGCTSATYYLAGMAPTERTLFQGEVARWPGGLVLTYTTVAKPMRLALKESTTVVQGLTALILIKRYLDQPSQEWLETLLDRYPDHIVEFSTYGVQWGTIPGYNTVFWEVRSY